jgi:hypothetical protein
MSRFHSVIKAQNLLGGDILLMYQNKPTDPVLFKVGVCEIIIIPCSLHNIEDTEGVLTIGE